MNKKLTLTLNAKLIQSAKRHAKKNGVSLSKLIEDYLKKITKKSAGKKRFAIKELRGILGTAPPGFDYKKDLGEILGERFLK